MCIQPQLKKNHVHDDRGALGKGSSSIGMFLLKPQLILFYMIGKYAIAQSRVEFLMLSDVMKDPGSFHPPALAVLA